MKLAVVTASPALASRVGELARLLVPHLRELCDLAVFCEPGCEVGTLDGAPLAPVTALEPGGFERLLVPIGNDPVLAFAPHVVRALGGTVLLHDWGLFDLARAAYPSLSGGGTRGFVRAVREGGLGQALALRSFRPAEADGDAPAFNRSIVRHADSFLVHSRELGTRVLEERNARTAIGLLPDAAEDGGWGEVARRCIAHLEGFPRPRSDRGARVAFGAWKAAQRATGP